MGVFGGYIFSGEVIRAIKVTPQGQAPQGVRPSHPWEG